MRSAHTQRNIANQVQSDDWSTNGVIDYGVGHLNASHVAVVGHTHCGGIQAAFDSPKPDATTGQGKFYCRPAEVVAHTTAGSHYEGQEEEDWALNNFLTPLITLRHQLPSTTTIMDLTLENVRMNVNNLVNSSAIQHAWEAGKKVCVHGWVYDIGSGLLSDVGVSKCGPEDK